MSRPKIIALIGVDGSGKSTQARRLAAWLADSGVSAAYHQNPGGRPTLNRFAQRFGRADAADVLGRVPRLVIEVAIRWLAIARALLRSRVGGHVAVMDRYAYCQYAIMRTRADRGERVARALFALFPKPDQVYFLAVTPRLAQHRVRLRGTDDEELSHLTGFDAAYRSLPEFTQFIVIDADADGDAVQEALRAGVVRHLIRRPAEPPAAVRTGGVAFA